MKREAAAVVAGVQEAEGRRQEELATRSREEVIEEYDAAMEVIQARVERLGEAVKREAAVAVLEVLQQVLPTPHREDLQERIREDFAAARARLGKDLAE